MEKIDLKSLELEELRLFLKENNQQAFRGEQIFNYIHKNKGEDILEIKTLSKELREDLCKLAFIDNIKIYERFDSKLDNTKKYLFALGDENIIEAVAMEYQHGLSVCISTQVGCRMGCNFCASTKGGLIRNLSPGEMLDQIYKIEKDLDTRVSNVVLMGSGEPLDNYTNVMKFLRIIGHEKGKDLGYRHITLSTCGLVPQIRELAEEDLPITLAISLHAGDDQSRREIMPIANSYTIDEIIEACKFYIDRTGRRVSFEYTLIDGVNDSLEDARKLIDLFKGMNMHLNLIPLNPIKEYEGRDSSKNSIRNFKDILEKNNIQVTIRREMGRDISASCGQLRRSVLDL